MRCGVDVSLAIDLVEATHQQSYDVAIVVSQDTDLNPAVELAKQVAQNQNRTVGFESAIPTSSRSAFIRDHRHHLHPYRQDDL